MDQQAMGTKPRSYTEDYKRQVVDLVASSGRTATTTTALPVQVVNMVAMSLERIRFSQAAAAPGPF